MKAVVVVQQLSNGEKHVAFSPNLDINHDDLKINAGPWKSATSCGGEVLIVGQNPELETALGSADLFTISDQIRPEEEPISCSQTK